MRTLSPFETPPTLVKRDDFIPPAQWSKDHWSTFAYIETRLVEAGKAGYVVGIDPRMKTNRRNLRVFHDARAFTDEKARRYFNGRGQPTMSPGDETRLRDGTQVAGHDDWACLQDFLAAGLVKVWGNAIEPGRKVRLTPLGMAVAALLRQHKMAGGGFREFAWEPTKEGMA